MYETVLYQHIFAYEHKSEYKNDRLADILCGSLVIIIVPCVFTFMCACKQVKSPFIPLVIPAVSDSCIVASY